MIAKTTQFKKMLQSNQLEFILEAHDGLSAKIVEEAGFKGIWGSGLAISAALGVRDNNLNLQRILDRTAQEKSRTPEYILKREKRIHGSY